MVGGIFRVVAAIRLVRPKGCPRTVVAASRKTNRAITGRKTCIPIISRFNLGASSWNRNQRASLCPLRSAKMSRPKIHGSDLNAKGAKVFAKGAKRQNSVPARDHGKVKWPRYIRNVRTKSQISDESATL